jgi:maleylpyruvate isomerase
MQLYGFFRSSAAFRVRIALNLKSVAYDTIPVNLRSGDQLADDYRAINPQGRVPSLIDGDDVLIQSMAIIEYLDETHPEPPFLPADAIGRARVRGLANIIACDIHPLNNSGVLDYMKNEMQLDADNLQRWYRNWVARGFDALEALLAGNAASGRFCHGDTPGLADICLVPQVFNARRFDCDLAPYPTLMGRFEACMKIEAFEAAQPANQPDAAE